MKKSILLLCTLLISGCASLINGTHQDFTVLTDKNTDVGATTCDINNEEGSWQTKPYRNVSIHRDGNLMHVVCENKSQAGANSVDSDFQVGYVVLDILLPGWIISGVVDGVNNAMFDYPNTINVDMADKPIIPEKK